MSTPNAPQWTDMKPRQFDTTAKDQPLTLFAGAGTRRGRRTCSTCWTRRSNRRGGLVHAGELRRGDLVTGGRSGGSSPGDDIPALEQAQNLLAATDEARALEAIGQPLEWAQERPGVLRAGNSACVFLIADAAPTGGTVAKRDGGTVGKQAAPIPGDQLLDLIRQWIGTVHPLPVGRSAGRGDALGRACALPRRVRQACGVFRATPRLFMLSSEPGSGKSAVLEAVAPTCSARRRTG